VGGDFADVGRQRVTGRERDRGAFKTPTLREVAGTAPYMHDGCLATLDDVVSFYSEGGRPNPFLDFIVQPIALTPDEQRALVTFLQNLSGTITEGVETGR
jgi:cytochrome c peroxidase